MKKGMLSILISLIMLVGMKGFAQSENNFKGYFNITDMGVLIGSPENSRPAPFSFMSVNGWHFTEQIYAGLGIGLEFPSGSYMPLVIDSRYYIRDTGFSPFLSFYGGYALPLDDQGQNSNIIWDGPVYPGHEDYEPYVAKGGWLLNPGFGIRHMFGENFGVIFAIGYRLQRLYYKAGNDRQLLTDYNRLTVKIGMTFR